MTVTATKKTVTQTTPWRVAKFTSSSALHKIESHIHNFPSSPLTIDLMHPVTLGSSWQPLSINSPSAKHLENI